MNARDLITVVGCAARVLRDSERTEDIIVAEELIAQSRLRQMARDNIFSHTEEGRAMYRDRPMLVDTNLDELRELDAETLGGAFVRFLDRNKLDYEITRIPTPYTDGEDEQYLLSRLRQSHDLWHTLIGVGTRGHEEVLVHAFSLGQTQLASSALIVFLGGIKHMVLERRWKVLHPGIKRAFVSGKRSAPLLPVYWERYWAEPLASVRERYNIAALS